MSVDVGHLDESGARTISSGPVVDRAAARSGAPLLEPAPGGLAERFAARFPSGRPVAVFLAAVLGGYALLVGLTILAGLFLTRVILEIDGVASWDLSISRRLEDSRTPTLVDLSYIGSTLSGGIVIPAIVGVLLVLFLALRRWRLAAFTLFVICVESGTYRVTSLVIHRDRPDVERLEGLPVNESFPSGHVAASVALFSGLLLVLASRVPSLPAKLALWALAVTVPAFEIWSRMLRGMHHATDVTAGVLMGVGAILITVFAARAAGAAAARRDAARGSDQEAATTEGNVR